MRLLVVDADPSRAAFITKALMEVLPHEMRHAARFSKADTDDYAPDLVILGADRPDIDMLEAVRKAMLADPRPIAVFVDRTEPGFARQAVRAGVSAYVVDGLQPERMRCVLEAAMARFEQMQNLRADLAKAQSDLAARKMIERAKGLLMKQRNVDEPEAYAILRKLAMNSGRPIKAVAADLVAFAGVLKGDAS